MLGLHIQETGAGSHTFDSIWIYTVKYGGVIANTPGYCVLVDISPSADNYILPVDSKVWEMNEGDMFAIDVDSHGGVTNSVWYVYVEEIEA